MKTGSKLRTAGLVLLSLAAVPPSMLATPANPLVTIPIENGKNLYLDFYGDNIFRVFYDPEGGEMRDPVANPPAQILVDNPRKVVEDFVTQNLGNKMVYQTPAITVEIDGDTRTMNVTDRRTGAKVIDGAQLGALDKKSATVNLGSKPSEYFYGGGVQNGRFSHRGKAIDIVNTNSWTDGGVASPTPFYWSTNGYGLMWNTFAPGVYDFTKSPEGTVTLTHETPVVDVFVMVDDTPVELLNDFYQLTGNPVLLPKFGFYEGHLNAYNRDYWKEDSTGILFEDGKRYKESQKDNGGIKESLNGELPGNYQFSARAVIDRYNAADMPLGWVLPNDGYGAGYGQTSTLDGNIENLRQFGEYARDKGVEIGLWTQSDLHPKEGVEALLQRDIVKEVRDAGVRVLKTDVAWVGAGYSFGLNGVADVGVIMPEYGDDARPFIISLDGWAGTQRYAGIWTGDQTGGEWEYIRFHIPTYIGSGLSGQPNITSDMDGIFGGKSTAVNVRDFQWKTFTPMELNMDGWGRNPKYPQAVGQFDNAGEGVAINRAFLKLKSELMPYAYTIAREAIDGKPMIRAMFLDYPSDYTLGTATKYQYLYGPSLLVAPIYQETAPEADGTDIRNGVYLPDGEWFDYFSGDSYEGGMIWNNLKTPIWKLPVFVKANAIIPMVNPNNNPSQIDKGLRIYELWPRTSGKFTEYDDDGTTKAYRRGEYTNTDISFDVQGSKLTVNIAPTMGSFKGFNPDKRTELRINASVEPKQVKAFVGGKSVKLKRAKTIEEFNAEANAYFYNPAPNRLNQWGVTEATAMRPQIWVKIASTDIAKNDVKVEVNGFSLDNAIAKTPAASVAQIPVSSTGESDITPYTITLRWNPVEGADCVEIEYDGMIYTNLNAGEGLRELIFEDLKPETAYTFKLRSKNAAGVSDWSDDIVLTTLDNPLEFAISGITAKSTLEAQPGFDLSRLFDFKESGDIWHTRYSKRNATPFDIIIDLGSYNTIDKFEYLPRQDGGNGTILKGTVEYSQNGKEWSDSIPFNWTRNGEVKTFTFDNKPQARYIRLHVNEAVGGFGSGRELYVFKVPGTPSYIPGDINNDGKIDDNDLMSYTNYTGLRKGDGDFDYVSMGDVNRNGLIDAYDISVVGVRLGDGIEEAGEAGSGSVTVTPNKKSYSVGETVLLTVSGDSLKNLNAISMAIPYNPANYEYLGIEPVGVKGMENLTNDRLHTSGEKVLYPTFVNIGDKPSVNGSDPLFIVKMKARVKGPFKPEVKDIILVDKSLIEF